MSQQGMSRREFVGQTAAGMALGMGLLSGACSAPSLAPRRRVGPNDRIVLGLIGCGGMGAANMRSLMGFDDVQVAALCDVDEARIPGDFKDVETKYGKAPDVYRDYRRMLDRKDIDAVIVGTPDHWHALNLIHAVEAGKDAYCEKPVSHNLVEARSMAAAARHHKSVVQVGTWQRSTREFTDAIAYVRAGKLGRVTQCRAWIADATRIGRGKVEPVPPNLDYEAWVGPAAMTPYQSNKVHWNWRWVMNTGGGLTTDWGVHMMDIALLGMSAGQDLVMPTEVSAYGGRYAILDDDRDAPDVTEALLQFEGPDFVMHWSVLRDHPGKPGHGTEFVSADGRTLRVWRGGWSLLDPDGKELPKEESEPVPTDHWRNFLDCVKSRGTPRADLASVAQTTIVCHLVNAALESGEVVRWDKARMEVVGESGKETLAYSRPYRKPWKLPVYS
ncbi:MAG: Gfo/Idh/MocA family oxidoreductase [Planctomycetota bacterium]|nr:Gfo/Idh/MocA family oxidoreductase [Planctomycetota bacterium]